jgi:putative transcriptional regulator
MIDSLTRNRAPRFFSGFVALVLFAAVLVQLFAAEPEQSLAGKLLVAGDDMQDPRFVESVIYLIKHDHEGTMGFVINRPIGQSTVDDLLKGLGAPAAGSKRDITIYYGGPVSGRQGFLLHTDDVTYEKSIKAKDGILATSQREMLEDLAAGKGPAHFLFILGYAGWAPGQLADEIKSNSWFVVPADKNLIFGKDAEKKWRHALDKRQIRL